MSFHTASRHTVLPNGFLARSMRRAGLVLSSSTLLACGGETADQADTSVAAETPTAAAVTPANACEVVSATDASTILGETVRDSVALLMTEGDRMLSQCNYASASNPVVASLMIRRNAPGETAAQGTKGARETMTQSGVTVEDVPGLGEAAFWGGNQLHVFTNKGWYLVASPSRSGGLAQARALAEKAMAKL